MRSSLEYADVVWDGCLVGDSDLLESLQLEGARVVTGAIKGTNRDCLLRDTSWAKLSPLNKILHKLIMMYSGISPYGHLFNTDTSLLRTIHLFPGVPKSI